MGEEHYGTCNATYQNATLPFYPKPAYTAAATLQQLLQGYSCGGSANVTSASPASSLPYAAGYYFAPSIKATASDEPAARRAAVDSGSPPSTTFVVWALGHDGGPAGFVNVTFLAPVAVGGGCFDVVSYLGDTLPSVCGTADGHVVVTVDDAPVVMVLRS